MLETLEHHDYYNPEGFTDSDRAGFPPILPQRRQCFQRPARPFIFGSIRAEVATNFQHDCNLNILDRVCQENNRHGREFIGAMKPRRVLYESQ